MCYFNLVFFLFCFYCLVSSGGFFTLTLILIETNEWQLRIVLLSAFWNEFNMLNDDVIGVATVFTLSFVALIQCLVVLVYLSFVGIFLLSFFPHKCTYNNGGSYIFYTCKLLTPPNPPKNMKWLIRSTPCDVCWVGAGGAALPGFGIAWFWHCKSQTVSSWLTGTDLLDGKLTSTEDTQ